MTDTVSPPIQGQIADDARTVSKEAEEVLSEMTREGSGSKIAEYLRAQLLLYKQGEMKVLNASTDKNMSIGLGVFGALALGLGIATVGKSAAFGVTSMGIGAASLGGAVYYYPAPAPIIYVYPIPFNIIPESTVKTGSAIIVLPEGLSDIAFLQLSIQQAGKQLEDAMRKGPQVGAAVEAEIKEEHQDQQAENTSNSGPAEQPAEQVEEQLPESPPDEPAPEQSWDDDMWGKSAKPDVIAEKAKSQSQPPLTPKDFGLPSAIGTKKSKPTLGIVTLV